MVKFFRRVRYWVSHPILNSAKYPISLFGGRMARYQNGGWDLTTSLFALIYTNANGKKSLHVESSDGKQTILLWANNRALGKTTKENDLW